MDEAVSASNVLPAPPTQPTMGIVRKGDTAAAFESATQVITGEICIGGQEHFYLEPFSFLVEPARPGASEPLQLTLCSQALADNQRGVASALGIGEHEVAVRARRIGGGFGGKAGNMNDLAAGVAIAATLLRKPARAVLRREEDFAVSGKRESLRGKYTVGIDTDSKIVGIQLEIMGNGGIAPARGTMIKGLLNGALSYGAVPNVRLDLSVVSSNIQSNTAMRALSVPGVAMICEAAFEHASRRLYPASSPAGLSSRLALRAHALATPTDRTPFGQLYGDDCNAAAVWSNLILQAQVDVRAAEIATFNAAHKWKKRGIHAMPSVFGVTEAMTGGAMVNVYLDGTVLVHHGGIEMGQGIHVKMAQIAAGVLNVPLSDVRVAETSTEVVPNTSKTAAAAGTDVNGGAVFAAATELATRLEPFRKALRAKQSDIVNACATTGGGGGGGSALEPSLSDVAKAAHAASVNLSAGGHRVGIDKGRFEWLAENDVRGWECNYFAWGGAVCTVEVDVLTGEVATLTADIVLDAGASINPAVDAGQVEGGFVQSLGWVLKEELLWGDQREARVCFVLALTLSTALSHLNLPNVVSNASF
jgi:xanthine dehydrogenase/oxidase